jgi:hypothetical protein
MQRETVELLLHVSYIIYGVLDSKFLKQKYFLIFLLNCLGLKVPLLDKTQCKNINFSVLKY